MNKKTMPVLLLIVGLIVGLVVGWLIFSGAFSNIGNAKAVFGTIEQTGITPNRPVGSGWISCNCPDICYMVWENNCQDIGACTCKIYQNHTFPCEGKTINVPGTCGTTAGGASLD